jgi:hypothetical protein
MSNKAKRIHMRKPGGSRGVCRYAARPSRSVNAISPLAFKDVSRALRCVECHRFYESLKNRVDETPNVMVSGLP